MKRAGLRHPKMHALAAMLDCSLAEAIGVVTLLHDWTADVAIAGNVGRWPDGAIARACEWRGDSAAFIEALVSAGWLDRDSTHRLVVHDWGEHCENWVRAKAEKQQISLLLRGDLSPLLRSDTSPDLSGDLRSDSSGLESGLKTPSPLPSLSKPSPDKPDPPPGVQGDFPTPKRSKKSTFDPLEVAIPHELDTPEFLEAWRSWADHKREIGNRLTPTATRQQLAKLADWGVDRAVAAIDHSIANGWKGIFEPKNGESNGQTNGHSPPKPRACTLEELKRLKQSDITGARP